MHGRKPTGYGACANAYRDADTYAHSTPERRTFTLVGTGDVLLHERLWLQAERDAAETGNGVLDFTPQLANIAPIVSDADLAICHLEVPLAPADGPYEGYPTFSGPPQVVSALDATGYDACSTASNHTFDQGAGGVTGTLDALDAAGIAHAGSARTPSEAEQTTMVDVETTEGPVKVGLLSYMYGFNGIPYPASETFWANEIDEQEILADAATARQRGPRSSSSPCTGGPSTTTIPTPSRRRWRRGSSGHRTSTSSSVITPMSSSRSRTSEGSGWSMEWAT